MTETLLLAAHQPDLFPYSGFWAKMNLADVFDLAVHDQFQRQGYQRRVLMRGKWASIPVEKPELGTPIRDVTLADGALPVLLDLIRGRYRDAPFWKQRGELVESWFATAPDRWLWEFNLHMIMQVRDLLGITTPIDMVEAPVGARLDGILDVCRQYSAHAYLSGMGGRAYMGDDPEQVMAARGVHLVWVKHEPKTPDSVLSLLFDEENFVDAVLHGEIVVRRQL